MIAVFEISHTGEQWPTGALIEDEAFAAARNDRNSPCPAAEPWLNLETSMCVPAAAAAGSNVFGLPTSFAAPLPQHYIVQ